MPDRLQDAADDYSFRFFSPEQVDQILLEGSRRGREGSHAAIERILKHEPGLQRAELWQRIRRLKAPAPVTKYRRALWSPEDEKIVIDGYRSGWPGKRAAARELLRRHPDWRPHVIWRKAAKLGLVQETTKRRPQRHRQSWSEEDDRTLLSLAGYKRLRMIAKRLHRSERSVRYRLAVLGKSSRTHFDGYARRALAEELHFGRRTVQRLIAEGLLEVHDPRITPESLDALRKSGRLASPQVHQESVKLGTQATSEPEIATSPDADNHEPGMQNPSPNFPRASRAKRVWREIAQALNVSLQTVENLIVDRTLKMFDPRITERSLINLCRRNGSLINWDFLDVETRGWLQSSMSLDRRTGKDAAARLNSFRRHALVVRRCTACGRAIRGNAFFSHIKGCKSPSSPTGIAALSVRRFEK